MADDGPDIKGMTADIVASYVSGNQISASELPALISKVFSALSGVDAPPEAEVVPEATKNSRRAKFEKASRLKR